MSVNITVPMDRSPQAGCRGCQVSWDPMDDDPPKKVTIYRNSSSLCDCDMCTEDPAEETDLDIEDVE